MDSKLMYLKLLHNDVPDHGHPTKDELIRLSEELGVNIDKNLTKAELVVYLHDLIHNYETGQGVSGIDEELEIGRELKKEGRAYVCQYIDNKLEVFRYDPH